MAQQTKFCPRCGKPAKATDSYCIKCGYNFIKKRKKSSPILIGILIVLALWIVIRIFLKKSIIPEEVIEFVKGFIPGLNKTG